MSKHHHRGRGITEIPRNPNERTICAVRQDISTKAFVLGFAKGHRVRIEHGTEDWLDLEDFLLEYTEDIEP